MVPLPLLKREGIFSPNSQSSRHLRAQIVYHSGNRSSRASVTVSTWLSPVKTCICSLRTEILSSLYTDLPAFDEDVNQQMIKWSDRGRLTGGLSKLIQDLY
jgi:hypothetical protein